jgi:hypothetical protein
MFCRKTCLPPSSSLNQELDPLQAAVLAEQKRRGRKSTVSAETSDKSQIEPATVHLTPGKLNAVRAAFKAGVKPSQIARQFGLSRPMCGRRSQAMHRGERRTAYPDWMHAARRAGLYQAAPSFDIRADS